jgi:hypothetical protein
MATQNGRVVQIVCLFTGRSSAKLNSLLAEAADGLINIVEASEDPLKLGYHDQGLHFLARPCDSQIAPRILGRGIGSYENTQPFGS